MFWQCPGVYKKQLLIRTTIFDLPNKKDDAAETVSWLRIDTIDLTQLLDVLLSSKVLYHIVEEAIQKNNHNHKSVPIVLGFVYHHSERKPFHKEGYSKRDQ